MSGLCIENWRFEVPSKGEWTAAGMLAPGACVALSGPSGCGKTTLLKTLAGLRQPLSGRLFLDGLDLTELTPDRRRLGFSFQGGALFPHLDVAGNLEFPLRFRADAAAWDSGLRRRKALEQLSLFGLESLQNKFPHELSGGERQRIALLRLSLAAPRWLLLDEPFAALDDASRTTFIEWLIHFLRESRLPTLLVTHRLEEAQLLAQKVVTWPSDASTVLQF